MNLAITIKADENVDEMYFLTLPYIMKYADKIGAEVVRLKDNKGLHYHYKILQLYDLFEKYDRIIVFDCDIVIRKDCPNLFDIVPYKYIGTVLEDKGSRLQDRRERIRKVQEKWGDIGWKEGYINTGVAVFSKCHRDIFKKRELWLDNGYDDVYLGYWINKLGYKIFELPYTLNHMRMFSETWNGSPSKFDSWIIHEAGGGIDKSQQIISLKSDIAYWNVRNLL